jgi:phosphoribosylformimino-5-aminoimidazole carboxamide ribotide isomerase
MRVIPVIDVMNGVVVHAVGGRRDEYRPIASRLTDSIQPVDVARALIEACRPSELYLADLDAIRGAKPALDMYRAILHLGVRLWVDAGVCSISDSMLVAETACDVVASLETVASPEELGEIVAAVGPDRVVFSLDLSDGLPLREWPTLAYRVRWPKMPIAKAEKPRPYSGGEPLDIVSAAVEFGITRLIVLDLSHVGGGRGTGTEDLCSVITSTFPHVEVISGGGVSGIDEIRQLAAVGVKGVLIASALHDKRLRSTQY